MNIDLDELRDKAYRIACEHGFHEENHRDKHLMGLVITELAEVVEADRKGLRADMNKYNFMVNDHSLLETPNYLMYAFNESIKGSIEEELADVVIRLLDYAGVRDIYLNRNMTDFELEVEINATAHSHCFRHLTEYLCFACVNQIKKIVEGNPFDKEFYIYNMIVDAFAIAKNMGIDLLPFIEIKMEYNKLREKKHGKKY